MRKRMSVFGGNANPALTAAVCKALGIEQGKATVSKFSDGETRVEILENVRGTECFIVQPTCAPQNDNLMELMTLIDAMKRASAKSVTAVFPYFGYARQERKSGRSPITAALLAAQLEVAGVDRVLALDLHTDVIAGFFRPPVTVDTLSAIPVFRPILRELKAASGGKITVVSPDAGGIKRARAYAKILEAPIAIIDKRRDNPNESEVMNLIGDVNGRICLIVDDMIDTAGTLCKAAAALKANGATEVYAIATHAVLSGAGFKNIAEGPLSKVWVTDSTPIEARLHAALLDTSELNSAHMLAAKLQILTVADHLADAIKRVHFEDSVSSTLE